MLSSAYIFLIVNKIKQKQDRFSQTIHSNHFHGNTNAAPFDIVLSNKSHMIGKQQSRYINIIL